MVNRFKRNLWQLSSLPHRPGEFRDRGDLPSAFLDTFCIGQLS